MSETKHTPGPWVAERNLKAGTVEIYGRFSNEPGRDRDGLTNILTVECRADPLMDDAFPKMHPELEANAALIAAAPDLLAALKDMVLGIDAEFGPRITDVNFPLARAAIAKAEGRQ